MCYSYSIHIYIYIYTLYGYETPGIGNFRGTEEDETERLGLRDVVAGFTIGWLIHIL